MTLLSHQKTFVKEMNSGEGGDRGVRARLGVGIWQLVRGTGEGWVVEQGRGGER